MFSKDQKVSDVMTSNPECVTENESIQKVARLMLDCDCGAIPVVQSADDKRLVGMITDRDIVTRIIAQGRGIEEARVADAMSRGVHTVKTDEPLGSVYKIMASEQVRRVPVVDQNDRVVGIVAVADIATDDDADSKLAKTVEEISEGARPQK